MRYADCGANIVGMTIVTTSDLIKTNPDLVRRFVRATVKSWEEAKKNPGAAVDAALKVKPDLNRQSHARPADGRHRPARFAELQGHGSAGARRPTGTRRSRSSRNTATVKTDKPWTAFHTNEFLPK